MQLHIKTTKVYKDCEKAYSQNYPIMIEEGGSRCFIGDTLVQTEKGHIPIKDIQKGMQVLSFSKSSKKLEWNKVIEKFRYKCVQPLIRLKTKNGTITSTYDHNFFTQGQWTEAYKLAERSLETHSEYERKIFYQQLRKIKNYELEMHKQGKINASSINEEKPPKKPRFLPEDNDKNKWEIQNNSNTQRSSKSIHSKPTEKARGKSQERKNERQPSRKFRMGNTLREPLTFIQDRTTKTKKERIKRNEQTNRTKSKRNNPKIYSLRDNSHNVSKRIQRIPLHNKNNLRTEQKEKCLARNNKKYKTSFKAEELREESIISAELFIKKIPVYDIEVEKTKSYCITKNNYIVHNSSKTYNILIWLIQKSLTDWNDKIIDICRKAFPSVRDTVMFDFFEILKRYNLYSENNHNKTENIYKIGTNIFRFFGLDQEQKVRGRKRNFIFINEANELNPDDFKQLNQRTGEMTIIDYNPSTEFGWYYDIQQQNDVAVFHSTYKDNPFLPDRIRKSIEAYKDTDENYWRVFGLGLRGVSETTIFKNWSLIEDFEGEGELLYGMDFGFNNETTLLRVIYHPNGIIIDELLYKSGLTSDMIVNELDRIREDEKINYSDSIIGDSARPEVIQDIYRAGYNIKGTRKGKDSVLRNVNFLKKHKLYITKRSTNLIKELKSYKWKTDKDHRIIDEPVKLNDHLVDALFYSLEDKANDTEFAVGSVNWT